VILILSCDNKKEKTGTIISGKLNSTKSKTVYLNRVNHFDNLNENYTIDSTSISENGDFKFEKQNLTSELVTISTEKFKPFTYQIYSKAPQTYFFGNCEKFFTSIPTFYITNEESININWNETQSIDSISSPDNTGILQVKLREFYLNSNKINTSKLDYDSKLDYKTNWEQLLIEKLFDLKAVNLDNIKIENSFDNYLYSEIYLGHLNKFLNWFEQNFPEKVENSINNPKSSDLYSDIFREYDKHKWNPKSLEYYKFTERFVNYNMNVQSKSFENYYQPTENKRKLAGKVLSGKNREQYLKLLDERIKNVL
jgi:hypothetical protein|tara:strand:+ start:1365 stop:2297 length:933 start_codon:yes stop_codon:yes gene_type:complete